MSKIVFVQHITSNPYNHLPDRVRVVARKGLNKKRVWEFKNLSTDCKMHNEYNTLVTSLIVRGYKLKGVRA
jgi:hypothetical protein